MPSFLCRLAAVYESSVLRHFKKLRGLQDGEFSGNTSRRGYAEEMRECTLLPQCIEGSWYIAVAGSIYDVEASAESRPTMKNMAAGGVR